MIALHKYIMIRLAYMLLYPIVGEYGLFTPLRNAIDSAAMDARSSREPGFPAACDMLNRYEKMLTDGYVRGGKVNKILADVGRCLVAEFMAVYPSKEPPHPVTLARDVLFNFITTHAPTSAVLYALRNR